MQLSLAFPSPPPPVNNRVMAGKDRTEADKVEAAKKLRNKALRLLTTREHSREELLRKLAQAKARRARQEAQAAAPERDEVERVIDELAAQGWQSDERYAEAMVRRLTGQASRRFIEEKLATAGIKKDAARDALESLEQDDVAVATALWQRRYGEVPADDKARQRQIRFLLTRGFHLGDAFKIVPRELTPAPALAHSPPSDTARRSWKTAAATRGGRDDGGARDAVDMPAESGFEGEYTRTSSLRAAAPRGGSLPRAARAAAGTSRIAPRPPARFDAQGRTGTTPDTAANTAVDASDGSRSSADGKEAAPPAVIETTRTSSLPRRSFKGAVKRARPWGARNDADPSDE